MFLTGVYAFTSSCALRPLGAAYVPILLSKVEQEQIPSRNWDREAIVVGARLCDGEGEHAPYMTLIRWGEVPKRFAVAKTGYGTIFRKTNCRNPFCRTWTTICRKLFGKLSLSQFSANCFSANCPVLSLQRWVRACKHRICSTFVFTSFISLEV